MVSKKHCDLCDEVTTADYLYPVWAEWGKHEDFFSKGNELPPEKVKLEVCGGCLGQLHRLYK